MAEPSHEPSTPVTRATIWRFLRLALPYRRALIGGGICLLISSLLGLVLPWLIRGLIDGAVITRELDSLPRIIGALLGVFLVQTIFGIGQSYLLSYAGERLVADLRRRLYRHLQSLSTGFFDGRRVGELMSRLTNDVAAIQNSLTGSLLELLRQAVLFVGSLTLVLVIDWRLAAIVLAVAPPIILIGGFFGRRLQTLSNETQAALGTATTVLEETIAGSRTVKAFAREGYEVERYGESVERTFGLAMRRVRVRALFDNPGGALMPGQFAQLRLGRAKPVPALLVNERAVGTDQDRKFVLVVGDDNKAAYREVSLGASVDGLRIVTRGLAPGERIVVNGLQRVRPGALVAPQPAPMATLAARQG